MKTILVVDDAPNIVELLRLYLEGAGYATLVATDGPSAVEAHRKHRPDLVVLDVMLPGHGRLRGLPGHPPRGGHAGHHAHRSDRRRRRDRRPGAWRGRLRHEAVQSAGARRPGQGHPPADRRDGPPRPADRGRHAPDRAAPARGVGGGPASWSCGPASSTSWPRWPATPAIVLSREALLEDVWGTDFPGETRTVDVHVSELRKKLGPDGPTIESVRGIGYRLIADA